MRHWKRERMSERDTQSMKCKYVIKFCSVFLNVSPCINFPVCTLNVEFYNFIHTHTHHYLLLWPSHVDLGVRLGCDWSAMHLVARSQCFLSQFEWIHPLGSSSSSSTSQNKRKTPNKVSKWKFSTCLKAANGMKEVVHKSFCKLKCSIYILIINEFIVFIKIDEQSALKWGQASTEKKSFSFVHCILMDTVLFGANQLLKPIKLFLSTI